MAKKLGFIEKDFLPALAAVVGFSGNLATLQAVFGAGSVRSCPLFLDLFLFFSEEE